ncbi:MAG: AAA domain-containing protein [Promethearchaeota archaeon]
MDLEYQRVKDIPSLLTLFDGQFIGNDEDNFYIYQFEIPPEKVAPETDEVEIFIDKRKFEGKVLETFGQFIHVALASDEGKVIDKLTLSWESGFLLKKLMERIESVGKNSSNYNLNLAEDLISPTSTNSQNNERPDIEPIFPSTLDTGKEIKFNHSQERAIEMSLKNRITFVWGPPGTGKTTVLGGVVYNLYRAGYKILLASNTNRAVDVALSKVIDAFRNAESPLSDEEFIKFLKGKIVRYGNMILYEDPILPDLHFSRYVEEELKKRNAEIEPLKILLKQYLKAKQEIAK